ncbi:MAG: hypothetical protein KAS64_05910 [Spirochaetes bacterium]|nr:hypothetical protein [Spirochaetota bacterium]
MFSSAKIELIEIMVLHKEVYNVTKSIGEMGVMQIIPNKKEKTENEEIENTKKKLKLAKILTDDLKLKIKKQNINNPFSPEKAKEFIDKTNLASIPLIESKKNAENFLMELNRSLDEIQGFKNLNLDFSKINDVSFLHFKYGSIPSIKIESIKKQSNERIIIIPLEQELVDEHRQAILAVTTKKGRFTLETMLSENNFRGIDLPKDITGIPSQAVKKLEKKINSAKKSLLTAEKNLRHFAAVSKEKLTHSFSTLIMHMDILKTIQNFEETQYTTTIRGWVAKSKTEKMTESLEKLTGEKIVINKENPLNLTYQERKKMNIPVILNNRKFFKPFESIISDYGYPEYGEIEPTPIVAIGFILMFGIMFGDVGQGAVLVLAGIVISFLKSIKPSIRKAGLLVILVGLSAAFFGFVFGSFFGNIHTIPPLWREPMENAETINTILLASIAFGIVWINTGLLLNLINRIKFRDLKGAIFEKTGLIGIAFYLGALYTLVSTVFLNQDLSLLTILLLIALPLFLIFIKEPLYHLIKGKPVFENGIIHMIMEGSVEIIETLSYYLGNTVSFVRIGAFALAHGGLGLAIMSLVNQSDSPIIRFLILAVGNLMVIIIEGLIVYIQTLRLNYYEFFSKFYSGTGKPFTPFTL